MPCPKTAKTMTYRQALARIPKRRLPEFWVGSAAALERQMAAIRLGRVTTVGQSPSGRPLRLVAYGEAEPSERRANYGSAVGGRDLTAYCDKAARQRPVVYLVGPVHGQETEGLTGVMNLIRIVETGADLRGREQPLLRGLAERCRLLILPTGNPDGLARFRPGSLCGMEFDDLRFWGQGTWRGGRFFNWPDCKRWHPIPVRRAGFLGCYFNDAGVNPMHDDFLAPMGPEAPAILRVARDEAPDVAVSLHSCEYPPLFLRPAYVPLDVQAAVRSIGARHGRLLRAAAGIGSEPLFRPEAERRADGSTFNLASALYHASGAVSFVFESPHGTTCQEGFRRCEIDLDGILDAQLLLYRAVFEFALRAAGGRRPS